MTCELLICFLRLHDVFSCIVDKPNINSKVSYAQCFPLNIWKYENKISYTLMFNVSNFGGKELGGSIMFFLQIERQTSSDHHSSFNSWKQSILCMLNIFLDLKVGGKMSFNIFPLKVGTKTLDGCLMVFLQ